MQFATRLIMGTVLVAIVLIVLCLCTLFLLWLVNRGLQFFLGLAGYEVGDFFGYIVSKIGIKKKKRKS